MSRRILISYVLMAVVVLTVLTVPLGVTFASRERDRLAATVEREARSIVAATEDAFEDADYSGLDTTVDVESERFGGWAILVDRAGNVVAESNPDPNVASGQLDDALASARSGKVVVGGTTHAGGSASFAAVPVEKDGEQLGAVAAVIPTRRADDQAGELWLTLLGLDVVALAVVGGVGWMVARSLGRPVRDLQHAAEAIAAGRLSARIPPARRPDDLGQVSESFNRMAERVQTVIESQQAFLADASHQLRTPLTALRLRVESLDTTESRPDVLPAVMAEVDRLADLVDALLAMARLDAAPGELVTLDPVPVARERVDAWEPLASENDLAIRLIDEGQDVPVRVVAGGLEQILDNLIANAVEHAPTGSTIEVAVQSAGRGGVIVAVADEGPGLSEANLTRAFDRFWRAPGGSPGGSGLGLSIVRRLAEASGGSAWAVRRSPAGVKFVVRLPSVAPGR